MRAFFEVARSMEYRRVVMQEGPAVLGYERYREQEARTTLQIVEELVTVVVPPELSTAEDPERASQDLQTELAFVLTGVRQQATAATGGAATSS